MSQEVAPCWEKVSCVSGRSEVGFVGRSMTPTWGILTKGGKGTPATGGQTDGPSYQAHKDEGENSEGLPLRLLTPAFIAETNQ